MTSSGNGTQFIKMNERRSSAAECMTNGKRMQAERCKSGSWNCCFCCQSRWEVGPFCEGYGKEGP